MIPVRWDHGPRRSQEDHSQLHFSKPVTASATTHDPEAQSHLGPNCENVDGSKVVFVSGLNFTEDRPTDNHSVEIAKESAEISDSGL